MKFYPEKCSIEDKRMQPFIDPQELWNLINTVKPTKEDVRDVIKKIARQAAPYLTRNGCVN